MRRRTGRRTFGLVRVGAEVPSLGGYRQNLARKLLGKKRIPDGPPGARTTDGSIPRPLLDGPVDTGANCDWLLPLPLELQVFALKQLPAWHRDWCCALLQLEQPWNAEALALAACNVPPPSPEPPSCPELSEAQLTTYGCKLKLDAVTDSLTQLRLTYLDSDLPSTGFPSSIPSGGGYGATLATKMTGLIKPACSPGASCPSWSDVPGDSGGGCHPSTSNLGWVLRLVLEDTMKASVFTFDHVIIPALNYAATQSKACTCRTYFPAETEKWCLAASALVESHQTLFSKLVAAVQFWHESFGFGFMPYGVAAASVKATGWGCVWEILSPAILELAILVESIC